MADHRDYWNTQFSKYQHVWGETPSKSAEIALALFRQHQIDKILVPGSGYGRNSKLFSTSGLDVTGIEISDEACALAREYDPATKLYNGSFLEDKFVQGPYQGIYCFNVLQLFLKPDRIRFVQKSAQLVSPGGSCSLPVFPTRILPSGKVQKLRRTRLRFSGTKRSTSSPWMI